MMKCLAAMATVLLSPAVLQAADAMQRPLTGGLRLWAGLAFVLAVILFVYAAAKRWLPWPAGGRGGAIQVCETRPLGPKKALYLVKVRDRELLLGVTGEHIALLCEMPAPADDPREETFEQTLERMKETP
ncbi:flagellar biogenesis protein FliO [Syntrophotalea carbinolica DSM 2380]|uniref:Flagellar protein n=1 Tax=Syntrophotalea carbinolica (strain DSM 2380 / NBRC 103641 / GraBd1) TaxID=338963 RepID=Q3A5E1_SYNC1|nr:flagellar biosynthetic protein FliO [Syntrophotalea carbinolica]ABA88416.1 flagellar biogenesis protein FliO [Syntrophotalea carbinolica DSM 2380]